MPYFDIDSTHTTESVRRPSSANSTSSTSDIPFGTSNNGDGILCDTASRVDIQHHGPAEVQDFHEQLVDALRHTNLAADNEDNDNTVEPDDVSSELLLVHPPSPSRDPLLNRNTNRFVLFPIKHPEIWAAYKAAEACFWIAEDIDLSRDLLEWDELARWEETSFVAYMLAYSVVYIGTVMVELPQRFSSELQSAEARAFYGFQTAM